METIALEDFIQYKKYQTLCDFEYISGMPLPRKGVVYCKEKHLVKFLEASKQGQYVLVIEPTAFAIGNLLIPKHPQIKKWYATNINSNNKISQGLPMGIPCNRTHGSYLSFFWQALQKPKTNEIFCYARNNMNIDWITWDQTPKYQDYLSRIRDSQFTLVPPSEDWNRDRIWYSDENTYKTWEALYLGTVPIVLKNYPTYEWTPTNIHKQISGPMGLCTAHFKNLPIIFVDRWENMTPEFLEVEYEKIKNNSCEMLKFSYWDNQIKRDKEKLLNISSDDVYNNSLYKYIEIILPNADEDDKFIANTGNLQQIEIPHDNSGTIEKSHNMISWVSETSDKFTFKSSKGPILFEKNRLVFQYKNFWLLLILNNLSCEPNLEPMFEFALPTGKMKEGWCGFVAIVKEGQYDLNTPLTKESLIQSTDKEILYSHFFQIITAH